MFKFTIKGYKDGRPMETYDGWAMDDLELARCTRMAFNQCRADYVVIRRIEIERTEDED